MGRVSLCSRPDKGEKLSKDGIFSENLGREDRGYLNCVDFFPLTRPSYMQWVPKENCVPLPS